MYYCECRWLSRGKSLTRAFELRDNILELLNDIEAESHAEIFSDKLWLSKMSYLGEVFAYLNTLNSQLQGTHITKYHVFIKIKALNEKIELWIKLVQKGNLDPFVKTKEYTNANSIDVSLIKETILEHLKMLKENLKNYFPDLYIDHHWIYKPFEDVLPENLNYQELEELIDLKSDEAAKQNTILIIFLNFGFH